jgi:hypothetical protein
LGKPETSGTWAGYPMDEQTTLWVNTAHPEALNWYSQIMNREKKSIDFAQTFARRNALKHLSGIQKAPGPTWSFPVICWRPTSGDMIKFDATDFVKHEERVSLLAGSGNTSKPVVALLNSGTERIETDEALDYEDEQAITDEDQAEAIDVGNGTNDVKQQPTNGVNGKTQSSTPPPLSAEDRKILANLNVAKKDFSEEYIAACQSIGVEPDADHTPEVAGKLMLEINRLVDSQG